MDLKELTHSMIGRAMVVHSRIGPGLLESAYATCLEYELNQAGFSVQREEAIPLIYDDMEMGFGFRADLIVDQQVIIEIKAKKETTPIDQAQLLSYLKLTNLPVGLLINFHVLRLADGIKRLVNNN